ncbi:hypothetical protein AB205_0016270, partial [Aquarana catesbeiana]
ASFPNKIQPKVLISTSYKHSFGKHCKCPSKCPKVLCSGVAFNEQNESSSSFRTSYCTASFGEQMFCITHV